MDEETYLGDGLYVSWDGEHFRLRAPRARDHNHFVFLDAEVLRNFLDYLEKIMEED